MWKTTGVKSFMISDLLRCDKNHEQMNMNMKNEPTEPTLTSPSIFNDLKTYICHGNEMQKVLESTSCICYRCTSSCRSMQELNLSNSVKNSEPTLDMILWQHYLLRERMMINAKPRKGGQIRFTNEQTVTLENQFEHQKYLSPTERKKISFELGLTERQIKTWFQNRRAKWRRSKQTNEGCFSSTHQTAKAFAKFCDENTQNQFECDN